MFTLTTRDSAGWTIGGRVGPVGTMAGDRSLAAPEPVDFSAEWRPTHFETGVGVVVNGANLAGGHYSGSPSDPPASNITPAAIGTWTQADFNRTLRTGRDPRGHELNPLMPWSSYGQLDDDELTALWRYLQNGIVPEGAVLKAV